MSDDIEKTLAREESELVKDSEIQRILSCFKLDSYTILELYPGSTAEAVKKQYRKKSLLIHPDKTSNPRASDAFDLLKKAQSDLSEKEPKAKLDEKYTEAKRILIREKKWDPQDERVGSGEFLREWRHKLQDVLLEEEFMKRLERKRRLEEEGKQRQLDEEERELKKRRNEAKRNWEDKRDERVAKWRKYTTTVEKKKNKKKQKVLA